MGDSETVMAENSIVTEYPPVNYTPIEYNEANSVPTAEGGDTATVDVHSTYTPVVYNPASSVAMGETVDLATEPTVSAASVDQTSVNTTEGVIYTVPDGSGLGVQSSYSADPNSTMQEAPVESTHVAEPEVGVAAAANPVSQENAVTAEPAQASLYDSSVNGNGVSEVSSVNFTGHDVNGIASNDVTDTVPDQQYDAGPPVSTEEERLWSIVKTNSLDFSAWTALIEETEKVAEDNILKIRNLYDTFLAEFPLCYGYWKKYADHEARLGSIEKVVEVYERAVGAVTYSVDIWLHYCVFAMSTYGGDPDTVRRLFERGLAYVGTDYLSYPLWDKYIEYEFSQQEWCHLATIYTRILENPNQQLDRYFNSFRELAGSRPLSELRTNEEAAAMVAANAEDDGQGVESEVHPDSAEHSLKPISAGLTEADELEKYVAIREEIYKKAKEFDSKIIGFETAIRRPYFHVRPLNGSELENWHNYLNFIESGDDFNKVVKLYERCLIACANYPEYWIRYVLCMEASGSIDLATNALARATQVFVKRQPEIHLFAARFKEKIGDTSAARAAYQLVHSGISPGLLEAIIKHANMEYRLGHKEEAFSLYEQAIATERGKEHSQTLPILFIQYSRFQMLVAGNAEKAREILDGAVESVQLSKSFLEGLIQLESLQLPPKRINYIGSLVEKFIMPNSDNPNPPSTTDREDISSIYLEFLDLFGDGKSIQKAADRHAKLFLSHRSTSELKKRSAEDYLASEKNKLTKAYNVSSPAQSVMGAYPNAQNQWPASYAVQPQAYVQAPQAQGQQWNPAYAQQVAYSGYSGYNATYTQPQVPVSAPQSTAYNAYPTSYPTQTFPQQSYAQPATAAAFPPVQPQAQVSQAYYGNYY